MTLQHLHSLPRLLVLLLLITHITASPYPQLPPLLSTPITTLITLSTLNDPPPAELQTKYPSGKCAAVNKGEALCCAQQLDGQQPVVKEAAALLGYELNENSVNGFMCLRETEEDTCPQGHYELCCQVTALVSLASLLIPPRASIFCCGFSFVSIRFWVYVCILVRM
ncbi:hypothetical protein CJF30_00005009 [Rutstroemia sp. NJR-2017a BBW]|nr:hypothetical protein CJF30_00005009 [Rutstroemia sp. NJR-2017a BBW]